jgi:glycosyltransferase involved in cell wall biosynthesis
VKILYLCPDAGIPVLGHKGAAVHVRELVAAFVRTGHQVVVAAPVLNKSPWEKPENVAGSLLQIRLSAAAQTAVFAAKDFAETLGAQSSLASELRRVLYNQELQAELTRRFDTDPPDFIYERASLHSTAGAVVARRLNVPLILELNAPLALEQSAYRGAGLNELAVRAEAWICQQADVILTVSETVREHALSLGIDPQKVHALPNGVDASLFQPGPRDPALRMRWGIGDGPVLGFVGGLRPWHGVAVLPELLAQLSPRHPGLRLLIVGDGQLRPQLERSLRENGLAERAIFTGPVPHDQMPAVMRQFDVALAPYPALDHPFYFSPLKLFEYMACGVAVVAANCGQIPEIIRDGENGLLYPPGDLQALAAACDRLLINPKLRFALGQSAASTVRNHYTWDQNVARIITLANSVIAARNRST